MTRGMFDLKLASEITNRLKLSIHAPFRRGASPRFNVTPSRLNWAINGGFDS